jgi:hypothetical protein
MLLGLNNADTDADAAFADQTNDAADEETAANAAKATKAAKATTNAAKAAAAATTAAAAKAADAPEERRAARLAAALLAPRAVDSILLSLLSCKEAKRLGHARTTPVPRPYHARAHPSPRLMFVHFCACRSSTRADPRGLEPQGPRRCGCVDSPSKGMVRVHGHDGDGHVVTAQIIEKARRRRPEFEFKMIGGGVPSITVNYYVEKPCGYAKLVDAVRLSTSCALWLCEDPARAPSICSHKRSRRLEQGGRSARRQGLPGGRVRSPKPECDTCCGVGNE